MSQPRTIEINNKKAEYLYSFIERFSAGIVLGGTEIKSIRSGGGSINEAYCIIRNGELVVRNMNIPEYSHGNLNNHAPLRIRKLLLKKRELDRIETKVREKGVAIIPLRLFMNERGYAKLEIALARGKKTFDKRESIKKREGKREMDRVLKSYKR